MALRVICPTPYPTRLSALTSRHFWGSGRGVCTRYPGETDTKSYWLGPSLEGGQERQQATSSEPGVLLTEELKWDHGAWMDFFLITKLAHTAPQYAHSETQGGRVTAHLGGGVGGLPLALVAFW